jgi:hypothetical protein
MTRTEKKKKEESKYGEEEEPEEPEDSKQHKIEPITTTTPPPPAVIVETKEEEKIPELEETCPEGFQSADRLEKAEDWSACLDAPQRINLVAPISVSIRKDRIIETAPEAGK